MLSVDEGNGRVVGVYSVIRIVWAGWRRYKKKERELVDKDEVCGRVYLTKTIEYCRTPKILIHCSAQRRCDVPSVSLLRFGPLTWGNDETEGGGKPLKLMAGDIKGWSLTTL